MSRVAIGVLLFSLVWAGSADAGVRLVGRDEPVSAERALAGDERLLPPRRAPFRFELVGLHWRGDGRVWFRTGSPRSPWSVWRPARPEAEDAPDPGSREGKARAGWTIGNPYWTGSATRIQYRLSGRVARLRAYFVSSPLEQARRTAIARTPRILSRAAWRADERIVRAAPRYADRVAFAVVHHTAGGTPTTPAESAAIVRAIEAYHVRGNGWNDIGYNFLVDRFGQVFEGRRGGVGRNVIGAHAQGFNTGSVGVAVIGSYGSAPISAAAREALVSLLAWRLDLAHVDPLSRLMWVSGGSPRFSVGRRVSLTAVSGHRDTGYTSCPGSALYRELGALAAAVAERGLPKLYSPRVAGALGGPLTFTARLSAPLDWTVTVFDEAGVPVAVGRGSGTAVAWTWDSAGIRPGAYSYAIAAGRGARPAQGSLGTLVPLELETVGAHPAVVTPNGDGVGDNAKISVTVTRPASVRVWLEDTSGSGVSTIFARPLPRGTTRFSWNGLERGGAPVPDGRYRLVAEALSGTERASRATTIVVDRTLGGFSARPRAISPNGDGRLDELVLGFDLVRRATARVRIVAGRRTAATVFFGKLRGGGRRTFSWSGAAPDGSPVPDGRYRVVVAATTPLGTRRLAAGFVVDTRAPRVAALTARRRSGRTLVRLELSEPARLVLSFDDTVVAVRRNAGRVGVSGPRASAVRVVAWDAAANASRPKRALVRASARR